MEIGADHSSKRTKSMGLCRRYTKISMASNGRLGPSSKPACICPRNSSPVNTAKKDDANAAIVHKTAFGFCNATGPRFGRTSSHEAIKMRRNRKKMVQLRTLRSTAELTLDRQQPTSWTYLSECLRYSICRFLCESVGWITGPFGGR